MARASLKQYGPPGTIANERQPAADELYATPAEMLDQYGMTVTEAEIRFAMSLIHSVTCRPSLWPEVYEERLEVPSDRQQVILAVTPVVRILSAAGRYSYGRRDRRALNQVNYDYLAALAVFGSPPRFTEIDVDQIELYEPTGECWLPTGAFLINYTQVAIKYLAGYNQIPARILAALAMIVNEVCTKGSSDRISYSVGRVSRRYATPSFITSDIYDLLSPYICRSLF
jgi:hypothetical protein